jgi:methyl-accepting chemotaxis protein
MAGKFLEGDGLSGTNVTDTHFSALVDDVYGSKGAYSLIYAAPVKNAAGKTVAVWANYADFGLVEDMAVHSTRSTKPAVSRKPN